MDSSKGHQDNDLISYFESFDEDMINYYADLSAQIESELAMLEIDAGNSESFT